MFVFFIMTEVLLRWRWSILGLVSVPKQLVKPPSRDGYTVSVGEIRRAKAAFGRLDLVHAKIGLLKCLHVREDA